jgi:hypothetical protein
LPHERALAQSDTVWPFPYNLRPFSLLDTDTHPSVSR